MKGAGRGNVRVHLSLENDGAFVNHMVLSMNAPSRKMRSNCYDRGDGGYENVTAAMLAGLHEPVLDPGSVRDHEIAIRGGKGKRRGRSSGGTVRFRAWHYYDGWARDVAAAKVRFR